VPLAPRPFALLQYLAEHPDRLISKDELLDAVWPGVFVGDASVKVAIREIRRALDDPFEAPRFIETVHGRGYRFRRASRGTSLPASFTSFIGRERELAAIERALDGSRLVTLRGVGGCGKTRLAHQFAVDQQASFSDGVWWIDLAGVERAELVVPTIASTVGIRNRHDRSLSQTLCDFVRSRSLLIVLDNCEHVAEECAAIARALLTDGPQVKVLATSREPLRVTGETVFVVPPLQIPEQCDNTSINEAESVRLFADRAQAAGLPVEQTDSTLQTVAAICRRLDGLPLAIELVAARAGAWSLPDLLHRISEGLSSFPATVRAAAARHSSLTAVMAWSEALLDSRERALFQQLSVFASTFSLDAVRSVCQVPGGGDVGDLLAALVDKSLVTAIADPSTPDRRYLMLEVVRQYARDRLGNKASASLVKAHADYFTEFAAARQPLLNGRDRQAAIARLTRDRDNLRLALDAQMKSEPREALRLAAALWWWWLHTNQWQEGRGWLEATLERCEQESSSRADALCGAGALAWFQGEHAAAEARLEAAVRVARRTGPANVLARSLDFLGQVRADRGQVEAALTCDTEAVAVARESGDRWELAIALIGLGNVMLFAGRRDEAQRAYEESAALCRAIPDPWALGMALRNLGALARHAGDLAASVQWLCDSLDALGPLDDRWFVSRSLEELAKTLVLVGAAEAAARLFGAAEALREHVGAAVLRYDEYAKAVAAARAGLGDAIFQQAWAQGRALDRNAAVALAAAQRS
jgi:non-specific serine/threonine protein kinase